MSDKCKQWGVFLSLWIPSLIALMLMDLYMVKDLEDVIILIVGGILMNALALVITKYVLI